MVSLPQCLCSTSPCSVYVSPVVRACDVAPRVSAVGPVLDPTADGGSLTVGPRFRLAGAPAHGASADSLPALFGL